ncbi:unnamed protein product [Vitrella brassicaformis CCMP3155]|uniref:Uncharacterized protein n=1 Tax=Vitrella brassicaformis (strain CCMP3155) TaxID=1169540 RepID=A0A0G4GIG2_VITBC|nr:unnamed protein product [Vitrella brassicaformis CCMP3155]|eukprot:CEM29620.1 unnamed protein product [Vitrella brassicaformis CCMP3155]
MPAESSFILSQADSVGLLNRLADFLIKNFSRQALLILPITAAIVAGAIIIGIIYFNSVPTGELAKIYDELNVDATDSTAGRKQRKRR